MKKKPTKKSANESAPEKDVEALPADPKKRRKVLLSQAKHLLKEGKGLLKKYGKRISEGSSKEIEEALQKTEACVEVVKGAEGKGSPKTSVDAVTPDAPTQEVPKASDPTEVYSPDPLIALARSVENLDEVLEERVGFGRKTVTREYIESIGYAVLVALFIRTFFIEAFQIPSGSMLPTLGINDHIFVNKLSYGLHVPTDLFGIPIPFVGNEKECDHCYTTKGNQKRVHVERPRLFGSMPDPGDVIVFICPDEKSEGVDYIKRVVATPGQTIRMIQNRLVVDGKAVPSKMRKRLSACNMSDKPNAPHYCTCSVQEETLGDEPYLTQHLAQGEYLVTEDDTLSSVAERFGLSPQTVFEHNKEKPPFQNLNSASEVSAPLKSLGFADYSLLETTDHPVGDIYLLELPSEHRVRAGETLSQLADKFNTTPWDLCAINLHQLQRLPNKDKYLMSADPPARPGCLTMEELAEAEGANPYNTPLPDGMTLELIRNNNRCAPLSDWPLARCDATRPPACYGAKNRKNPIHFPVVKIPEDHVLTFGDNRDNSEDGRYWGLVPLDAIKGKAVFRWWATDLGTLGFLPQSIEEDE